MKNKNYLGAVIILFVFFFGCSSDDDNQSSVVIEIRDRTEQQASDKDSLTAYLSTHYYNSTALAMLTNPAVSDIVITELAEGETVPSDHTLLSESSDLLTRTTVYEETTYEYYILKLNQGGGVMSPNFSDDIRASYEGSLVEDASVFDSQIIFDSDLINLIPAWQRVFPEFNTAEDFDTGSNGVVYKNYGVGVMFIPSGLAYFSGALDGIPSYSNLVFKFALFQTEENDHDNDGVPTYIEDLNGNLDLTDDDTDEDGFPNYIDADDDADGVATVFEDLEPDSDLEVDRDGDGDPTNDIGDEDPTNDDTDGDGIPNYLDEDSTTSNQDT